MFWLNSSLWSIQKPDPPSMPMASPLLPPPGIMPIFMLRMMMLLAVPLMRIPKFADEPFAPMIEMLLLLLIDTSVTALLHWPQGFALAAAMRESWLPV